MKCFSQKDQLFGDDLQAEEHGQGQQYPLRSQLRHPVPFDFLSSSLTPKLAELQRLRGVGAPTSDQRAADLLTVYPQLSTEQISCPFVDGHDTRFSLLSNTQCDGNNTTQGR